MKAEFFPRDFDVFLERTIYCFSWTLFLLSLAQAVLALYLHTFCLPIQLSTLQFLEEVEESSFQSLEKLWKILAAYEGPESSKEEISMVSCA